MSLQRVRYLLSFAYSFCSDAQDDSLKLYKHSQVQATHRMTRALETYKDYIYMSPKPEIQRTRDKREKW